MNTILQETPQFKQCSVCEDTLPATAQFFFIHPDAVGGFHACCRVCHEINPRVAKIRKIPESMKRCRDCKDLFPATSDFFTQNENGLYYSCKKCQFPPMIVQSFDRSQRVEVANISQIKDRERDNRLKRLYNITSEQYDRMLEEQNSVCLVCCLPETSTDSSGRTKSLAVDHDHVTGQVRALLCQACNQVLGQMSEDPERIRSLLAYAEWCQSLKTSTKAV